MTAARTNFCGRSTNMEQIERLLVEFMTAPVERFIYNEFSLQFELGIFFRDNGFNVFFERNVNTFDNLHVPDGEKWTKHEIDLVLEKENRYHAIELKFPRNGEHPEQMFHFLKDIRFMEQVKDWAGFYGCYAMTVTLDPLFHRAPQRKQPANTIQESPIYSYFRNGKTVEAGEVIEKPTGTKGSSVRMGRSHRIEWKQSSAPWNFLRKKRSEDGLHYYIVSS